MKLKKGDKVIITTGRDKGKKGKIERLFPRKSKVSIPGINVFKKHLKRKDEKNPGGIIEIVRPFPLSKVALLCSKCGQATRVGYKIIDKEKLRICRKCKEEIN